MDSFEKNGKQILAFSEMLSLIQKSSFVSSYLVTCKKLIFDTLEQRQVYQLKRLSSVIASMEVRYNPLAHFVANVLFLWDLRVRVNAERWRSRYGKRVRLWFEQTGNIEAVISLGTVFFENSNWVFPVIKKNGMHISAEHASHPLIHVSKRVYNSYTFSDNSIAIITGSNMSGKSTFLRTVGINCVLAFAGSPVCARAMSCSLMHIYSSMRIEDNLADSVSTFYAELMRIKMVIKANSKGIPLLCLLDELFRGTNSEDRHDGAVAVLKRLLNKNTIGIISTHDLQLCSLSEESPESFVNYHFKEYYDGKEIRFDYKINSGPSTTRNALFLLKMLEIV
jgi:DNA mismatch repair ATPase MutS